MDTELISAIKTIQLPTIIVLIKATTIAFSLFFGAIVALLIMISGKLSDILWKI